MSGRSFSLPCAVFFEGDAVAVQEPPQRARRERHGVLPVENIGQLEQRDVDLSLDRTIDDGVKGLDAMRALVTASRLGFRRPGGVILATPAYPGRPADLEAQRRAASRHAALDSRNQSTAKILRQGFRHACWPPRPADMVNHNRVASGKPRPTRTIRCCS